MKKISLYIGGTIFVLLMVVAIYIAPLFQIGRTTWVKTADNCDPNQTHEWTMGRLSETSLDSDKLEELALSLNNDEIENVHSVLIIKDGKLVFEHYFEGEDNERGTPVGNVVFGKDTLHDLRSVTKSVISVLIGIAHKDGDLPNLNAPLSSLLSNQQLANNKQLEAITLRHVLTMSAGLSWDEISYPFWHPSNDSTAMTLNGDPINFLLDKEVVAKPGEIFSYNSGLTTVLTKVIENATGTSIDQYAAQKLFCPLGIDAFEWYHYGSGDHIAGSGLRLKPRDMAKLGLLMLQNGRFGDQQIVTENYAKAALREQIVSDWTSPKGTLGYGYQWWVGKYSYNGEKMDLPFAIGFGGQRIYLLRPDNMVIVITAGNYGPSSASVAVFDEILGAISKEEKHVSSLENNAG